MRLKVTLTVTAIAALLLFLFLPACEEEQLLDLVDNDNEDQLDELVENEIDPVGSEDEKLGSKGNNCSVSVVCDGGQSKKSCSGSEGRCSASNAGYGRVICNGKYYSCPKPIECDANETLCGGQCVNLQWDRLNCGKCGLKCPTKVGYQCMRGQCQYVPR